MSFEIVLIASLAAAPAPSAAPPPSPSSIVGDAQPLLTDDEDQQGRDEERRDREDELYDEGTEALDEGAWDRAVSTFRSVAEMKGRRADAAVYWRAYAESKQGRNEAALGAIEELRQG